MESGIRLEIFRDFRVAGQAQVPLLLPREANMTRRALRFVLCVIADDRPRHYQSFDALELRARIHAKHQASEQYNCMDQHPASFRSAHAINPTA
jgi:hypothetical protein